MAIQGFAQNQFSDNSQNTQSSASTKLFIAVKVLQKINIERHVYKFSAWGKFCSKDFSVCEIPATKSTHRHRWGYLQK